MQLSGRMINIERYRIFSGISSLEKVDYFLRSSGLGKGRIFILCDQNTRKLCLPELLAQSSILSDASILEIPAGEQAKTLQTAAGLWEQLLEAKADRHSLLINLGGGVVSDLGGFVSSGYKRGIPYINIPTTLIGMADAAIGGKTGINMGHVKNQVGSYASPSAIFISFPFLSTLSGDHLRSGMAEVVKSALVGDAPMWNRISRRTMKEWIELSVTEKSWMELIEKAVTFKNAIVRQDYREKKLRKVLNFGHTMGHAVESLSQRPGQIPLFHGDAVAIGMICESYLSSIKTGLSEQDLLKIVSFLSKEIPHPPFMDEPEVIHALLEQMKFDKKNSGSQIRFTLLRHPGSPQINVPVAPEEIVASWNFYLSQRNRR